MDLVARESVSVNREPPVTLSVADASALLASTASSVRGVSAQAPTLPLYPFLLNLGKGTLSPLSPTRVQARLFWRGLPAAVSL